MRWILSISLLATCAAVRAQDAQIPEHDAPLMLDAARCVAIALAHNPRLASATEDVAAAEARVGQAQGARLPQIQVDSTYTYIDGFPVDLYSGGAFSFLTGSIAANKWQVMSGVQLEQVLFSGGRLQAAHKASAFLAASQHWQRRAIRDEVEFAAKQGFYNLLLAQRLHEVADARVAAFERHLRDSRDALEVGLVSRFQVLRAETERGARISEQTAAASQTRLAQVNLLRTLGQPQHTPVAVAGDLAGNAPGADLQGLIDKALDNRAELHAIEAGIAAAEQRVREAKGAHLPRAGAQVRYDDLDGGTEVTPDGWSVSVGVEWELFAGGSRRASLAEAKARVHSLGHQRAELRQLVELDVRSAWFAIKEADARILAEKKTRALAEEGLRMAELRYQEGVGTQAEVIDAETALSAARTQLAEARHAHAVACAALEQAIGHTWMPETPGL